MRAARFKKLKISGWMVCSLAALFYCYEYLLRIEPSVIMPQLMHSFNLGAAGLGLMVSMYYWAYTPLQAVVGVITDYFGSRRVLISAICFCATGSLIFALTHNVYVAATGRFIIGVGSAFAFVGVLKLAAVWLPRKRFALFAGIATSLGMLGAIVGDVTIVKLVHTFNWRSILVSSFVIAIILIPIFILFVHDSPKKKEKNKEQKINFAEISVKFLKMIGNKQIWLSGLIGCMLYTSLSVFAELWGVSFLHHLPNVTQTEAARLNSMVFWGWLFGSPINGWMSDFIKSRSWPLIIGCSLAAITFSIILYVPLHSAFLLGILLFCFGFFCSAEVICFAIGRESVRVKVAATALAWVNMLIMAGGMLLQPLIGQLLEMGWSGEMVGKFPIYSLSDYHHALSIIVVGLVLSVILACFLKESFGLSLGKPHAGKK